MICLFLVVLTDRCQFYAPLRRMRAAQGAAASLKLPQGPRLGRLCAQSHSARSYEDSTPPL
jgi:hypothetical protein